MQKSPMQKLFDAWMLERYGNQYSLEIDCEGYYCRKITRRMFEAWSERRGLSVV